MNKLLNALYTIKNFCDHNLPAALTAKYEKGDNRRYSAETKAQIFYSNLWTPMRKLERKIWRSM